MSPRRFSSQSCSPPFNRLAGVESFWRQWRASEVIQIYERDPAKRKVGYPLGCAYARAGRREEAEKVRRN